VRTKAAALQQTTRATNLATDPQTVKQDVEAKAKKAANMKDHGRGTDSPTMREIRDEYNRLARHRLPTITDRALRFVGNDDDDDDTDNNKIVVAAHNVQSLLAHHTDLETDVVMRRAEYLVLNETWMDAENLVQVKGFELANFKKREPCRTAGGVAIYRSVDNLTQCEHIHDLPEIETLFRAQSGTGNIRLVGVNVRGRRVCVLGSIYIHTNVKLAEAQLLCFSSLAR
jgi:hypothetical protein